MVLNSMLINGPNYRIIWLTISGKFNNPPFLIPSFIKLDSLTNVQKNEWNKLQILCNGNTIDIIELSRIKKLLAQ